MNMNMNIQILRYGMLASKGHCVSLNNKMKIARRLPQLPEEVGIIVLRKKNNNAVLTYMFYKYVLLYMK